MRHVLRRIGLAGITVLLVMAVLAAMTSLVPGEPARVILGPRASPELIERVREEMHLDDPIPVQIWIFSTNALRGDLGKDFVNGIPVRDLVANALSGTVALALASMVLGVVFGVGLGVISAARAGSLFDRAVGVFSITLLSVPSYVIGLLLLLFLSVAHQWLPASGAGSIEDPADWLSRLAMPTIALAVGWGGYLARLTRASMLDVLASEHVRAARALGLPNRTIWYRYALRNAITPIIAFLGVGAGWLLSGAVVVELIFNRPGLGRLMVDAVGSRNYTIVRGCTLVIAIIVIAANLIADLMLRLNDPRIDLQGSGRS